jgi:hypothetical protein
MNSVGGIGSISLGLGELLIIGAFLVVGVVVIGLILAAVYRRANRG